jgi:1A family penicillin-binding protein
MGEIYLVMVALKKWVKKHWKELATDATIGIVALGLVVSGGLFLWISTLDIPDLSSFEQRRVLQSTKIYDRTGEILLYDLHQDVKRTLVGYEDISHHIKNATIAIEDDTFFEHAGVRPLAIVRSMFTNIVRGVGPFGGAGGSTITQQVIKNSILVQEKTLTRKIKEAILAIRLEQVLSKEEILLHYLNESPYGGTIYGVEEASLAYFGKPASDVTLAEAAYIAALPQAPTYYSPYGNNIDELERRKNYVLERMLINDFITKEDYEAAKNEKVEWRPQVATGIRAPHFVFYVREYLARKYGEESLAERGFRVITTLDWELQDEAEKIVREYALRNETSFNASNAALVAADPKTGEILAMVGSRDYFDEEIDGNYNIAVAERQPGSSFKPFVYAHAFEKGYTPNTVVFDLKTQFSTTCATNNFTSEDGCYSPSNYDNAFRGPVNLRNALAQSLNIPAVKVLYLAGIQSSIKLARDMGITTLTNAGRYGLTLVLGGGEVKLVDMVAAYGVFANEGVKQEQTSILRIEDSRGNIIEEHEPKETRIMDREVALMISDVLSDNVARTPLYGANSALYFGGRDVAAKTGTTNDKRDAWVIGYTPNLVVGAWAGNNDNSPMSEISGLIITPLWREFMNVALSKLPEESFAQAPHVTASKPVLNGVWFGGTGTTDDDNLDVDLNETIIGAHEILHYVYKDNPTGPYPVNPAADPQYELWEYPVRLWQGSLLNVVEAGTTTIPSDRDGEEQEESDEDD